MDIFLEYGGIALRSVAVFLIITLVIRFFGHKEIGDLNTQDFVLIILLAETTGHSMLGDNTTFLGGLVAFGSIFLTNKALNLLTYHFPKLRRLLESEPTVVILNGRVNKKSLRKLHMTEEELRQLLREKGHLSAEKVKFGVIENDGQFSLIENEESKSNADGKSGAKDEPV